MALGMGERTTPGMQKSKIQKKAPKNGAKPQFKKSGAT
jgi:hypothetical protein